MQTRSVIALAATAATVVAETESVEVLRIREAIRVAPRSVYGVAGDAQNAAVGRRDDDSKAKCSSALVSLVSEAPAVPTELAENGTSDDSDENCSILPASLKEPLLGYIRDYIYWNHIEFKKISEVLDTCADDAETVEEELFENGELDNADYAKVIPCRGPSGIPADLPTLTFTDSGSSETIELDSVIEKAVDEVIESKQNSSAAGNGPSASADVSSSSSQSVAPDASSSAGADSAENGEEGGESDEEGDGGDTSAASQQGVVAACAFAMAGVLGFAIIL